MELSVEKYLQRINYTGDVKPTKENLVALQRAHLMSVPYENLDIYYGRDFTLAMEELYDKIVLRHRGGYCFEINGLYAWLLRQMGYEVEEYFGRWLYLDPLEAPARRHRVIRVKFPDGDFITDVAVGQRAPLTPLAFQYDLVQPREGFNYRIVQDDVLCNVVQREEDGKYVNFFSFDLAPQLNIDFTYVHFYCMKHPDSIFNKKILVHIPTENGRNSIYSALDPQTAAMKPLLNVGLADGTSEKRFLYSEQELKDALKQHFGIVL